MNLERDVRLARTRDSDEPDVARGLARRQLGNQPGIDPIDDRLDTGAQREVIGHELDDPRAIVEVDRLRVAPLPWGTTLLGKLVAVIVACSVDATVLLVIARLFFGVRVERLATLCVQVPSRSRPSARR